jgi:putative restriction endonuclease
VCRLRHPELLDAAHILPDGHPRGLPVVPNGLSLCKLHHAAFDEHVLRVRPDYVIELREDVLHEEDGPMLEHGLKGFHGKVLLLPRTASLRPDPELLDLRYRSIGQAL